MGICTEKWTKMDAASNKCGYIVMFRLPENHGGDRTNSQCQRLEVQLDDAEVGHRVVSTNVYNYK